MITRTSMSSALTTAIVLAGLQASLGCGGSDLGGTSFGSADAGDPVLTDWTSVTPDAGPAVPGFSADAAGSDVVGQNSCASNPCFPGVECVDVATDGGADAGVGYSCGACPEGHEGDGVVCEDIDRCAGSPCSKGVGCEDVPASEVATTGAEYVCEGCASGYRDNGKKCVDINECKKDPCSANEICRNKEGTYKCVECKSGYKPKDNKCVDINECKGDPCKADQICVNKTGTYECVKGVPSHAKEIAKYFGLTNDVGFGGRPTFYFSKVMSQYPSTFTVVVAGCAKWTVTNNDGHRSVGGGLVIKQSEVLGRGMGVIAGTTCRSTVCYMY